MAKDDDKDKGDKGKGDKVTMAEVHEWGGHKICGSCGGKRKSSCTVCGGRGYY